MHEYSLVQALMERVELEARTRGASAVHSVSVRIGELAGIDVGLFTTAYETFRLRTICDQAALYVTLVPVQWLCGDCKTPISTGQPLVCPMCGGLASLVQGDELVLDRVELEVS